MFRHGSVIVHDQLAGGAFERSISEPVSNWKHDQDDCPRGIRRGQGSVRVVGSDSEPLACHFNVRALLEEHGLPYLRPSEVQQRARNIPDDITSLTATFNSSDAAAWTEGDEKHRVLPPDEALKRRYPEQFLGRADPYG